VVGLPDLGLIFCVPGDFLPFSLLLSSGVVVVNGVRYIELILSVCVLILCTGVEVGFGLILWLFVYWG
jgi:hypothetical protein